MSVFPSTTEVDIERRLARVKAEGQLNNGYASRQLYRLSACNNLADIVIEMAPSYETDYALARQIANLDEVERMALASGVITHAELSR